MAIDQIREESCTHWGKFTDIIEPVKAITTVK
jgi:hypothetical protein